MVCDSGCVRTELEKALQPTWDDLWAVAGRTAHDAGEDLRYVFEPIGLILQPPGSPLPIGYDATPRDAITFASTGGDGVHFSASLGVSGPHIVMTVPMQFDRPNVVVGQRSENWPKRDGRPGRAAERWELHLRGRAGR